MERDDFAAQLEHALRRVRSTGDLYLEGSPTVRPSRQRTVRISVDQNTRNLRFSQFDAIDRPERTISPPATAHLRDDPLHNLTLPPLGLTPPPPRPSAPPRRRPPRPVPPGLRGKVLVFFGFAGPDAKARSQLLGIIWKFAFGLVQYVVIITLLVIASVRESPTIPGISEWAACSKPLGVWNCIWLVRVALGCGIGYWDWRRSLVLRQLDRPGGASGDTESGRPNGRSTDRRDSRPAFTEPTRSEERAEETRAENSLPHTHLFKRLNLLTNVLSLVWFLAAHVFEYSSVNTCRHSSPHLWWLTFGILCILYLMLLEIFLIGLLIFILGPILYIVYNIVLLCIGRHPVQRAGEVNADIKKIPKSVVEQIPLVLYIPPPPEEEVANKETTSPITVPSAAHSYPPKPAKPAERRRRFKFAFFRRSNKSGSLTSKSTGKKKAGDPDGETWEDNWVPGDYPFVRLEGNRAACAICLMDFDEPERKDKQKEPVPTSLEKPNNETAADSAPPSLGTIQEVQVGEVTQADADRLKLEDAGEGPQPLRLLACGHVFHKTCIDPWLIDVSGRCPVCQRPVELPDSSPKKKRRRGRQNSSPDGSP